jgi:hypothetical protein
MIRWVCRTGGQQAALSQRAWLERRGIHYQVSWIGLAMEID